LEIDDNAANHDFLQNPANPKIIGETIKKELVVWLKEKNKPEGKQKGNIL
jgi:hypothetical protein